MSAADPSPTDQRVPFWAKLLLAGLGSVLLVGGALGWILRGSTILIDMADFFCL
jgi:hypothetical protein